MLKFKRLNITDYTKDGRRHYLFGDMLRQTTIKAIAQECKNFSAEQLKKILLEVISEQLDLMIIEE